MSEEQAKESKPPTQEGPSRDPDPRTGTSTPTPSQQTVQLDDANVSAVYANFCRISGTPEELVLDFALNTHPTGTMPEKLQLNERVILNFYTAKRLLGALQMAVQRHEATFGNVETDVRKRVVEEQTHR